MSKEFDAEKVSRALGYHTLAGVPVDGMVEVRVPGFRRFKESTRRRFEQQESTEADYDTGFLYVKGGDTDRKIRHDLGQVPTRYTIEFCEVQKPRENIDIIRCLPSHIWVVKPTAVTEHAGVMLYHKNKNLSYLQIAKTYLYAEGADPWITIGITSGYIRVLLWR